MGRKKGVAGRCQVGMSCYRGHCKGSNKIKVKAMSVAQGFPFPSLDIICYWAGWGHRWVSS